MDARTIASRLGIAILAAAFGAGPVAAIAKGGHSGGHSHSSGRSHSYSSHSSHAGGRHKAEGAKRDSHGKIARSSHAQTEFRHSHPCPSTGRTSGACPGYVIDHMRPLKRGGADSPYNMQWQTTAAARAKDKYE